NNYCIITICHGGYWGSLLPRGHSEPRPAKPETEGWDSMKRRHYGKEHSMAQQISRPILDHLFDAARDSGRLHPTDQAGGVNITRRLLLAASCACAACFMPAPSFATPMVRRQAPAFYRLMLGDFEVTALSDGSNMLPATKLLHGD